MSECFCWPDCCSEYAQIKVIGIPKGFGVPSAVPGAGCLQIITSVVNHQLSDELAIKRRAMMAIMGMIFNNGLTESAWGDWTLHADSALRTDLSKELSVQASLGYWDPLGFAKHDNKATVVAQAKRCRVADLQHGRVAMTTCIGHIVSEHFCWPGCCSEYAQIMFTGIPNSFGVLSAVPGAGWLQIITFVCNLELSGELAIDRLAMMAIMG
eukprot:16447336-Heterocapsa_arctica.AAC.1